MGMLRGSLRPWRRVFEKRGPDGEPFGRRDLRRKVENHPLRRPQPVHLLAEVDRRLIRHAAGHRHAEAAREPAADRPPGLDGGRAEPRQEHLEHRFQPVVVQAVELRADFLVPGRQRAGRLRLEEPPGEGRERSGQAGGAGEELGGAAGGEPAGLQQLLAGGDIEHGRVIEEPPGSIRHGVRLGHRGRLAAPLACELRELFQAAGCRGKDRHASADHSTGSWVPWPTSPCVHSQSFEITSCGERTRIAATRSRGSPMARAGLKSGSSATWMRLSIAASARAAFFQTARASSRRWKLSRRSAMAQSASQTSPLMSGSRAPAR